MCQLNLPSFSMIFCLHPLLICHLNSCFHILICVVVSKYLTFLLCQSRSYSCFITATSYSISWMQAVLGWWKGRWRNTGRFLRYSGSRTERIVWFSTGIWGARNDKDAFQMFGFWSWLDVSDIYCCITILGGDLSEERNSGVCTT